MKVKFEFGKTFKHKILENYLKSIMQGLFLDIGIQVIKPAEFIHVTITTS